MNGFIFRTQPLLWTLIAVWISGCGKPHGNGTSSLPSPQSENGSETPSQENNSRGASVPNSSTPALATDQNRPPFILTHNFSGTHLIMIHANPTNSGHITITEADAKALFDAMGIKTVRDEGNREWLPTNSRQGMHILCNEYALRSNPSKLEHSCALDIDYRAGRVSPQPSRIKIDRSVPTIQSNYQGANLTLLKDHPDNYAEIKIKGEDARALYFTLSGAPAAIQGDSAWLPGLKKTGQDIVCFEQAKRANSTKTEYSCSLNLNYRTGGVLANSHS